MSKTSVNLSDRVFFTIDYFDGSAYVGELDGKQKILVRFTPEEFKALAEFMYYNAKDYV
jgi:hypothetical protein